MIVANMMPKASEIAIGTISWAWALRSSSMGASPQKVVSEVNRIARKRRWPASTTAV